MVDLCPVHLLCEKVQFATFTNRCSVFKCWNAKSGGSERNIFFGASNATFQAQLTNTFLASRLVVNRCFLIFKMVWHLKHMVQCPPFM